MHTLKPLMLGFCLAATGAAVAAPTSPSAKRAVAAWPAVPDTVLGRMRGGIDLSNLVAYFAIERIVEVDGEVVARAEIVISNLDRLASGGMPTISVSGPLAQVIQIMNGGGIPGATLAPSSGAVAAPSTPSAAPVAAQIASSAPVSTPPTLAVTAHSPAAAPTSVAPHTNGTISSGGTQSGSMAQFGSALSSAVAVAASATSATGAGNATAETPSASAASLASAQPVAQANSSAASAPSTAAGPVASPASTPATAANTVVIPTPIIVVSDLPNATSITTAVQNEVRATTIQTQTTISATLNSLPVVNSLALASAIQAQVASAVGH